MSHQIETGSLQATFASVSERAAEAHWMMTNDPDEQLGAISTTPNTRSDEAGPLAASLDQTRAYQRALVTLAINGKLDKERFAIHMQAAHAQFLGRGR